MTELLLPNSYEGNVLSYWELQSPFSGMIRIKDGVQTVLAT